MHRRLQMRRQITLLLIAMRMGYGITLLVVFWTSARTSGSLLNQVHLFGGGAAHILFTLLNCSALLLIGDGLLDLIWPHLAARRTERRWQRSRWLRVCWLYRIRAVLIRGCGAANAYRHWFYLPPAFAALFVVPSALYLGAANLPSMQMLWLWLFACGISAALLEGAINNEKNRYA